MYLLQFFVRTYFKNIPDEIQEILTDLQSSNATEQWSYEQYCMKETIKNFEYVMGAIYVRELIHINTKAKATEMFNEIRNEFVKNLKKLDWMDDETRLHVREKVDAISSLIGYPDFILDPIQVNLKYEGLQINKNYYENNFQLKAFHAKQNLKLLDRKLDKNRWMTNHFSQDAYYWPKKNQVVISSGLLNYPFFNPINQKCLNYGGIGTTFGHEVISC